MTNAQTTLDNLFATKKVVSFRKLSSLLNIPSGKAQAILSNYASSNPHLTALWCVTNVHSPVVTTTLTTNPPPDLPKTIWALSPAEAAKSPAPTVSWFNDDINSERKMVKADLEQSNSLRDGRYNGIRSTSSKYDATPDNRIPGSYRKQNATTSAKGSTGRSTSKVMTDIKTAVKKEAAAKAKRTTSSSSKGTFRSSSLFHSKPLSAQSSASKTVKKENRISISTPTTKVLGKQASKSSKSFSAKPSSSKRNKSGRKSRTIVEDDSDFEDAPKPFESDDEETEADKLAKEQEKEEAERMELDQELEDLKDDPVEEKPVESSAADDEEPESPQLKEVPQQQYARGIERSSTPESQKRPNPFCFGVGRTPAKRMRKIDKEDDDGYIVSEIDYVTEPVKKMASEPSTSTVSGEAKKILESQTKSKLKLWTPGKRKNGNTKTKNEKKRKSKATSGKKAKKGKGDIAAYFMS